MRSRFALAAILLTASLCSASRISGTYLGHGANFAEMLQLTETNDGQISGVLSWAELRSDGRVTSEQAPVSGAVDADQVTLNIRPGLLSFLIGKTVAGKVKGNTIHLQTVDSNGNAASHVFSRGTAADFTAYTQQLKTKGAGIELSNELTEGAKRFRQTVQDAEQWIADAESHAQRIPVVKARYQEIETKMQSLVDRQRNTPDSVSRSQISVTINQGDVTGEQVDIEVDQVWDINIGNPGSRLNAEFGKWNAKCGDASELEQRRASAESAKAWESACKEALAEWGKFAPIFQKIMEQRAEVKSIESSAQARRKEIVADSNRMQ